MDNISINELIAEIEAKYPTLAESGDIDKNSIVFTVINALRKFGVNVQKLKSEVLFIDNSKAMLPEDFKTLKKINLLDPIGCTIDGNKEDIKNSYIFRQRIENPAYWNEITAEYVARCDTKIITEKIELNNSKLNYHYHPKELEIVNTPEANSIAADCIKTKSPYKATISNSVLNTNFDRGRVYIEYYSLQTNEDGDLVIPIFSTGAIYDYIENLIKIEISEYLINNNLNPQGISQLYQVAIQKDIPLKSLAMKESKFHGLGKDWDKSFKRNNQKYFTKFRLPR